jgi:2-polyprenyl-3-methyl-5-hydroxy-6-metoxy-1,4-benzoquinol methylase
LTGACPACGGTTFARRFRGPKAPSVAVDSGSVVPSSDRFGSTAGTVRRCQRCGHASLSDPPAQAVFEGAYADASDPISLAEEAGQVATAARDLERLERFVRPGRLLDVGCWTGSLLVVAQARRWRAEGLEPSAWGAERAATRGCVVRMATIDEARLEEGAYRAIVAADVIEHLLDPSRAIATFWRALEDDGVLFLTTPDAGSTVARVLGRRWWSVLPMHVQYFTRSSMTAVLTRGGFVVEDVSTHPKTFSLEYYGDRLAAFAPIGGSLVRRAVRATGQAGRPVSPDLRDRMAVIARKHA